MFYLLHGDHHLSSRQFLVNLTEQGKQNRQEIIQLDGQTLVLNDLIQATASQSMFALKRLVIMENLFSRQKSQAQSEIFKFLKKIKTEADLIFWEKKSIGKILQRNLPPQTIIKEFKTPTIIFKLVEQITPNSNNLALTTFNKAVEAESVEFIFAMIVRQMRLLLQTKLGKTLSGAPWIIGKLKTQASNFSQEQLEKAYQKLYIIDKQIKKGQTPMDLNWHLGVWLADL